MERRLPRWEKGSEIKAEQLNQLAEAVEQIFSLGVDGSSGLQITDSVAGRIISAIKQPVGVYGKVVGGIISAASGNTLGYGLVDLYYKDDDGILQPFGGPPEKCYNLVTSSIPGGKWLALLWVDEDWLAVLEDCAQ